MFANRLRLRLHESGNTRPVPKEWLDQFFMRNFTGYSAFDETLVAGEGELETGFTTNPDVVREQLERWLRGRKLIPPETKLSVEPSRR